MNNVLTDLAQAVNSIPEFYYVMDDVSVEGDTLTINSELSKHYERRFVSQLKSSYDSVIANGSLEDYSQVFTDSEVIKKYVYSNDPDHSISSSYSRLLRKVDSRKLFDVVTTIPDFLIHRAQSDWEFENQKLVVEAKTTPRLSFGEFALDLFKLNIYAEKHNFQNSVYLVVNNAIEQLQELLGSYCEEELYLSPNNIERIYVFVKRGFDSPLATYKLVDLL